MKPEPPMYTKTSYDAQTLKCNFLQKKVYQGGLYKCERCPLYMKSDGAFGCTMDKCSKNQITAADGFCKNCGDGYTVSSDGKSCN